MCSRPSRCHSQARYWGQRTPSLRLIAPPTRTAPCGAWPAGRYLTPSLGYARTPSSTATLSCGVPGAGGRRRAEARGAQVRQEEALVEEIFIPASGMAAEDVLVTEWLKQPGDLVAAGGQGGVVGNDKEG